MKWSDVIVFGIGAPEVEVAFIVNDEGWHAASDGMLGQFFEGGIPESADGMPRFKVGSNEVAPLSSDRIGGVVNRFVSGVGRAESSGPVNDGKTTSLVHELFERSQFPIGRVGPPAI